MTRLPDGYQISPERVPIPGAHITEAIGVDELFDHMRETERQRINRESDKDDRDVLLLTAAGMAIAVASGYYVRKRFKRKD